MLTDHLAQISAVAIMSISAQLMPITQTYVISSHEFSLEKRYEVKSVSDEYKDKVVKTTKAHFNSQEGFKTDGYLFGDGVCHLASLLYWVAKDAGLDAKAPTNHDFMAIPEIDKQYGVSIYSNPQSKGSNSQQNLYITNNKGKPVTFKFDYGQDKLKVSITETQ